MKTLFYLIVALAVISVIFTGNLYANNGDKGCFLQEGFTLTVHFENMDPHIGQDFYVRIVEQGSGDMIDVKHRIIAQAAFDVVLEGLQAGTDYYLEFFADLDGNHFYDSPPGDHAWRIEVTSVTEDTEIDFSHNTNFTDIQWELGVNIASELTIQFQDMDPHVGQQLEIFIYDNHSGEEVARKRMIIEQAGFEVKMYAFKEAGDYSIELWADLNENGSYDDPPEDHAWQIDMENIMQDTSIFFVHNTEFSSIRWQPDIGFENLEGDLDGRWQNRTYLTIGPLDGNMSVNTETDEAFASITTSGAFGNPAEITLELDGMIFEGGDRMVFSAEELFTGDVIFSAGEITGDIEHAITGIDLALRGNYGESQMITKYVMTGAVNAQGMMVMNSEREVSVEENFEKLLSNIISNYPNPFTESTTISFMMHNAGKAMLDLYDSFGNKISKLAEGNFSEGMHSIDLNSAGLSSGIYYLRMTSGNSISSRKIAIVK